MKDAENRILDAVQYGAQAVPDDGMVVHQHYRDWLFIHDHVPHLQIRLILTEAFRVRK